MEFCFDGLRAVFFNGTLKRSPEPSNTDGLVRLSADLMARHGVEVEVIRTIDRDIAVGVYPDMSEHGWATDEWPTLYEKVLAVDILVLCGPIWLGDPVTDALRREPRISWVGVRHEEAGAFAAGAQAQLTSRIGVCMGTVGPGSIHPLNGLNDAKKSHSPVLAIWGQCRARSWAATTSRRSTTTPPSATSRCSAARSRIRRNCRTCWSWR